MQYLASSWQYKGNCWGPFFFFLSSCFNLCFLSAVICFVSLWWIPSSKSKNIILPKIFMFHSVFPINTVEMGFFWKQTRWQFNKVSVHIHLCLQEPAVVTHPARIILSLILFFPNRWIFPLYLDKNLPPSSSLTSPTFGGKQLKMRM